MTEPAGFAPGLLAAHQIETLLASGAIACSAAPADAPPILQPASLDLRLGRRAWRVRASFLPGQGRSVLDGIGAQAADEIDLSVGVHPGARHRHGGGTRRAARPSPERAGRGEPEELDRAHRRLHPDHRGPGTALRFTIEAGYAGPLYAEVSPRTFPVRVRTGSRLAQIRFSAGDARLDDEGHRALHAEAPLVAGAEPVIAGGVAVSIDLSGFEASNLVGYRAKRHTGIIDIDVVGRLDPRDFWEEIHLRDRKELILDPGEFYLLASKEAVRVPPDHAAEMTPFDPLVGEFRVHYAGFFDPGFGDAAAGGAGSRAVLEVRSRDVPFVLEDGQIVGRLVYERMSERPRTLYGAGSGSNYQAQGLKLSKHFTKA